MPPVSIPVLLKLKVISLFSSLLQNCRKFNETIRESESGGDGLSRFMARSVKRACRKRHALFNIIERGRLSPCSPRGAHAAQAAFSSMRPCTIEQGCFFPCSPRGAHVAQATFSSARPCTIEQGCFFPCSPRGAHVAQATISSVRPCA